MDNAEYQAFINLKDNVWTKVKGSIVQNWTSPNCQQIAAQVDAVTGLEIDAKSIQRFARLTPKDAIDRNRTKDILSMFVVQQKTDYCKTVNTQLFQDSVKGFRQTENIKSQMVLYAGNYTMYYKDIHNGRLYSDIQIELLSNGDAIYLGGAGKFKGEAFLMQSNPNLFFVFKNEIECFFLIAQVGVTRNKIHLGYIGGCLTAVSRLTSYPFSFLTLLVKSSDYVVDMERVQAYFDKIGDNHRIMLDSSIAQVLNVRSFVESQQAAIIKRLFNLLGNWYIYTVLRDEITINRGKLSIQSLTEVMYKSSSNTYSNGKIMLKSSTSIVIQLETEEHFVVLTMDVERSEVLNFNIERALFLTIGVIKPVCGVAIFEKMPNTCTYEEMSAQYLKPTEEAYQLLEKKGVIELLKTAPNVYL